MGWLWIALLGLAVAVLVTAEWPRLAERLPSRAEHARKRRRRRSDLHIVRTEELDDSDDFAASVQRDLERLPTIKERDRNT
ncbi:MAG: hypothetical protein ACXWYS_01020 [Gaiellaceae bacterium]